MKRILSTLLAMLVVASCFTVTAFANTPSTYKLFTEDFQNKETGFDTNRWEISGSDIQRVSDPAATTDPTRADNNVLQIKKVAATTSYFHNKKENSQITDTFFEIDGKLSFEFDIYIPDSEVLKTFSIVNLFDHVGSQIQFAGGELLKFVQQGGNKWLLMVREHVTSSAKTTYVAGDFLPNTWYKMRVDFDLKAKTFKVYANGVQRGPRSGGTDPFSFSGQSPSFQRFDRINFATVNGTDGSSVSSGVTYYIDNIKVYQNVCADTNVQGFYNEAGTKIEAVDPVKTVFKTTLINRTSAAVDTMLLLTALDETESRLKDVRLISFAGANSEKVVEETFSNLGAGVKIKAIYLDGLTAIAPESIDSTLKTFEIPAASAATDGE